jgi:glycosyltransferase involved in cell wall biosynthesis
MLDISVVIPAYNAARHIGATIDAILAQTHPPRDVIVVNDGSTDTTAAVLAGYGDRITAITTPNQGVQAARNLGITRATGDWIALSDADDLWAPNYLEAQARLLRAAPDVTFSFCNFRYLRDGIIDPRDKFAEAPPGYWDVTPRRILPEGWVFDGSIAAQTIGFHPIFPSATMVQKALAMDVGLYDTTLRGMRAEDGEFVLRCLYRARTAALPEPLVTIRRHETNFSHDQVKVLVDEVKVLGFIRDTHPQTRPFHDVINAAIAQRRIEAIDGAFAQGNHALARRLFAEVNWRQGGAKLLLKRLVVSLPDVVGKPANALLQRLSEGTPHPRP